jgi:hypothetical protein
MSELRYKVTAVAALSFLLVGLCEAECAVRISFLREPAALQDTLNALKAKGCTGADLSSFKRAVEHYWAAPPELNLNGFPRRQDDFYAFDSSAAIVAALRHPLAETRHGYDLNCFDAVILLAGDCLSVSPGLGETVGPFLVPVNWSTNGTFRVATLTTARDAFEAVYPEWYREASRDLFPRESSDARIVLTAALFRFYHLPESMSERTLPQAVLDTLTEGWKRTGLRFPDRFEIVLCHDVNLSQRHLTTAHAGLLVKQEHGYTYLEKAGGSGPFVRLDVQERSDLLPWLAAKFKGAAQLGSTHRFVTFNNGLVAYRLDSSK